MSHERLYTGLVSLVAGGYLLLTLPGLSTIPNQLAAVLGIVILGHGLLFLVAVEYPVVEHSVVPMLGYGLLMLLNGVWRSGEGSVGGVLQNLDHASTILAVLLFGTGTILLWEEG